MAKVSIVIPSRNEELLAKTVEDVFTKATGEIEVIVVLDGPSEYAIPPERTGLTFIRKAEAEGLKPAVNDASGIATGKYLMKTDAHCMFGEGFDEILQADCDDDWVTTARRFTLIPHLWAPRPHLGVDYYYLGCPWTDPLSLLRSRHWKSKSAHRRHILIDDQMCIHGSMWLMPLEYFRNRIGLYDNRFGSFAGEPEEIEMKTWLGGGRVIVNKKTWYAHLHTVMKNKGYVFPKKEVQDKRRLMTRYWTTNQWEDRIHDFDWLIEKFWALPNWPKNWREYYEKGLLE